MKIDNVVLAEGVAMDVRGALTLVGFNQRALNIPTLPFAFKQVLVVSLVATPGEELLTGAISVRVSTPSGGTAFAFTQTVPVAVQAVNDTPTIGNLALDIPITANEPGVYEVHVTWQVPNEQPESRRIPIYVNSTAGN